MQKSVNLVLFNPYIGPLSGATSLCQSGLGSNGNEGILRIPQNSSITGTSPSDRLVSYNRTVVVGGGGIAPLQRSSRCILQSQPSGQYLDANKQTLIYLLVNISEMKLHSFYHIEYSECCFFFIFTVILRKSI